MTGTGVPLLHVARAREIAIKMTIARGAWYVEPTTAKTLTLLKTQRRIAAKKIPPLVLTAQHLLEGVLGIHLVEIMIDEIESAFEF